MYVHFLRTNGQGQTFGPYPHVLVFNNLRTVVVQVTESGEDRLIARLEDQPLRWLLCDPQGKPLADQPAFEDVMCSELESWERHAR